jgi:hypothetical protein
MASLVGAFDSWSAWWSYVTVSLTRQETQVRWADQYAMLKSYYLSNGLYEVLDTLLSGLGARTPELRPLRNPAFRVVEFYAAKLWPGTLPAALPIVTENQKIIQAIQQVWTWSNWSSEKQTAARWFATYGDMFLKVAAKNDANGRAARVYLQNIEPQYVTDFDADERGYLTYVRIDIPQRRRMGDQVKPYTHTEVWTKASYRLWEHTQPVTTAIDQLGPVTVEQPTAAFGIDFVPVVWQPFRNIGDERGTGAFTLAIDKIDEANRQATRLHQMLYRYNKALWVASANAMDAQGRPLPAPKLGSSSQADTLELDDDTILRLPGLTTLQGLVPPINYADALAVLNAQLEELQRDLPELAYYDLRGAEVSGKAVALLLGDAVDRLLEARGNAEAALIRADQMALTIGQALDIFDGLGDYAAGAFDHSFAPRPVLELDAELVATWVQAGMPLVTVLREKFGWDEERIARMLADKDDEASRQQTQLASALVQAQQGFDQNQEGA